MSRWSADVDAWLTRIYERLRGRYFPWGYAVVWGIVFVVAGTTAVYIAARFEGLSFGQFWIALGWVYVSLAVALAWALWARREDDRSIADASSLAQDELAAEAAFARSLSTPRGSTRATLTRCLLLLPPTSALVITGLADRVTPLDVFEIAIGAVITILAGGWAAFGYLELMQLPVRGILRRGALAPESTRIGLAVKLSGYIVSLSLISGTGVGALIVAPRSDAGLVEVYGLAIGVSALLLLVSAPIILTVLMPIDRLIAGTRAVGDGDLDAEVAVTSSDELGELTASFDQMLGELRHATEDLRASRARIVASADEARRKVERDLHDGAQQHLVLLDLKLGLMERAVADDPQARAALDEVRGDLERALAELRDLAHGIYPSVLNNDGLSPALQEAAQRAAIPTTVESNGTSRYRPELEAAVYFCCLEALQNAAKYAGDGATATVELEAQTGKLTFEVRDDGQGFDPSLVNRTAGIQNMADRIGALGGEVSINSRPGEGTRVSGSVPIGEGSAA